MAGFIVDASEAERLATEIAVNIASIMPDVRNATVAAGRRIQASARARAPRGSHTRRIPGSIWTKTSQTVRGVEVTIESKDPMGSILEYGTSRSGPHPFMKAALDEHADAWANQIADIAARIL